MKIIQKEVLNAIFTSLTDDTKVTGQLLPWNWLGDDIIQSLNAAHGFNWPHNPMAGYCLPFAQPMSVACSKEQYWLYFIANYRYYDNTAVDIASLDYSLFIEGETEIMNICLTGWQLGRYHGETKAHGEVSKGIVDYDGRVIFDHYKAIPRLMENFSHLLMTRELLRGDPYLACFATHHHNEVYRNYPYPNAVRELELPTNRLLKDIVWGK
ncbi:hypothetical protein pEaSNUABM37_00051 [Erwinia phage pEa_SNUABM_37]|nr:hypothetical protein pEaSNUABM37_00051 [Erwinia phage pEa_SNUABM_37]QXO10521.1 hypothetical protein pEaSNUABM48_00051 [Erwinia phage pEa_SNUABM_48]